MYDDRMYPDRYDRYAGSSATADSGRVITTYPGSATTAAQICRFNPTGGAWKRRESGETFDYDAELRVPASATILPAKRGDVPDKVVVKLFSGAVVSRTFTVVSVHSAFGQHQRAYLKELMP